MLLNTGARLGQYEILSALGAGGMGEVYKARDTRLDRTVAIKLVLEDRAHDPDFRARFEREASIISKLSHPCICALYDVGEYKGASFLVMEHLAGETLADRLQRGALKPALAISIAIWVADALDTAHRAGVIHRDLKPANIFLTKGTGKLLDFGLAKVAPLVTRSGVVEDPQGALTMTAPLTVQGTLLGTYNYMAPELLEGREADARSDVWSFGCVLYEMLAATRPFTGTSPASLIANVMHVEPPSLIGRQPLVSRTLDHIVQRCLVKDPDARWQTISDVGRELRWAAANTEEFALSKSRFTARRALAWSVAAALVLAAGAAAAIMSRAPAPAAPPLRLALLPSENVSLTPFYSFGMPHFSLSPDGTQIAFVASAPGRPPSLWIRPLDGTTARPLPGTEDASSPFWSPDGQALGFFTDRWLKIVPLGAQGPSNLVKVQNGAGGTWSSAGVILIGNRTGPLTRVAASGGVARDAIAGDTALSPGGHRWPQFLPDGRHFIYHAADSVRLGVLDSTESKELLKTNSPAVYAAPGVLLFVRRTNTLMAQELEPGSWQRRGDPVPVLSHVRYMGGAAAPPPVSVSANGLLAHSDGTATSMEMAWFDRQGNPLAKLPLPPDTGHFAISPDDRRIAFSRADDEQAPDIWVMDSSGSKTRFTTTAGDDHSPVWSSDGRHLLFCVRSDDVSTIARRPVTGVEGDQIVATLKDQNYFSDLDWSSDGRHVLLTTYGASSGRDVAALSLDTGQVTPALNLSANEIQPRFSPDGRWFAYASDETGRWEIYVKPFPLSGARWQVSVDGGSKPVWRRDGKELFFYAPDRKLMSVTVTPGQQFVHDPPRVLFETRMRGTFAPFPIDYDVTSDGRFLMHSVRPGGGPVISVVTGWAAALAKRAK